MCLGRAAELLRQLQGAKEGVALQPRLGDARRLKDAAWACRAAAGHKDCSLRLQPTPCSCSYESTIAAYGCSVALQPRFLGLHIVSEAMIDIARLLDWQRRVLPRRVEDDGARMVALRHPRRLESRPIGVRAWGGGTRCVRYVGPGHA